MKNFKIITLLLSLLLTACNTSIENMLINMVPRPQEPTTRSYTVKENNFHNHTHNIQLAGEIAYSTSNSNGIGIVLVSGHHAGEAAYDRDSLIAGHKYFLVIADQLVKRGYTVLRYDNRGTGKSTGSYDTASDNELATDAAAALHWLRNQSGLNLSASGFLGHSQGAVKALLASHKENPDFIVSLAGLSAESATAFAVRQNQRIGYAQGMPEEEIKQLTSEVADAINIMQTAETLEQAKDMLAEYAKESGSGTQQETDGLLNTYATHWWFQSVRTDTRKLIQQHHGPILSVYGSKDLLVSAQINEQPIQSLLQNTESKTFTFEGLNHLFQKAVNGNGPYEYWEIETTIELEVINHVDQWLKTIARKKQDV